MKDFFNDLIDWLPILVSGTIFIAVFSIGLLALVQMFLATL